MNETYEHHYLSLSQYRVYELDEYRLRLRFIDDPENYKPYQEWLAAGNIPEKVSGDRFISIVNGEVIENPDKDLILAAEEKETLRNHYKYNARNLIEQNVGDDKDLVADISKRLDILERGLVRLIAHVLGGTKMTEEYKTRYLNYAEKIISLVESEAYVPRADLEDEEELVARLIERQNAIGQIVKTEYLGKLKNEGLTE